MKVEKFLKQIIKTFSEEDFGEGVAEEAQDCLDEIQAIKNEIKRLYDGYTKVAAGDDNGYYGGICEALDWCEQMLEDIDKWKAGE